MIAPLSLPILSVFLFPIIFFFALPLINYTKASSRQKGDYEVEKRSDLLLGLSYDKDVPKESFHYSISTS